MNLPSKVRDDFGHSPVAFFEFDRNPQNYQYLVDNGLAVAKKEAKTQAPPSVEPTPAPQAE